MKTIIIGGVAAGASAAARLRRLDETAEIVLLEKGEFISYANCGLPYFLGGVIPERENLLVMPPERFAAWLRVDVRTGSEAVRIDREHKTVTVRAGGREYEETYDKLLLATGAVPAGAAPTGKVLHLWTLADMDKVHARLAGAKRAVVVGAGFIGLEVAENLRAKGLEVTIVQRGRHVLPTLDPEMAAPLAQELSRAGVVVKFGRTVNEYAETAGGVEAVLDDGERLTADLAIVATGVRPNSALAQECGLACGQRGHVIVDEFLKTSDPDIYAAGDVVEVIDPILGGKTAIPLAGPANKQGRIAADNIAGRHSVYKGSLGASVVKVGNLTAAAVGLTEEKLRAAGQSYRKIYLHPAAHAAYYPGGARMDLKLLFGAQGEIYGAQIVGGQGVDKRIDTIAQAMRHHLKAPELAELELAYAPPYSSAKDPVNFAGFVADDVLTGLSDPVYPDAIPEGAVLVDVREPEEHELGAVPGAVNIPLGELRERLGELDKSKLVVTYCQVGMRGYLAERVLKQRGFKAANLSGGWLTWKAFFPPAAAGATEAGAPAGAVGTGAAPAPAATLDVRALPCPGPVIKLKAKMGELRPGESLHLLAASTFEADLRNWARGGGHTLTEVAQRDGHLEATVRKGGAGAAPMMTKAEAKAAAPGGTAIIVFSNDLDRALAAMILANGLAAAGEKVSVFFTFWGLTALRKNPAPATPKNLVSRMFGWMLPKGANKLALSKMHMLGLGTAMMKQVMREKNVLSLPELIKTARGAGVCFIACDMAMDVMGLRREELLDVDEVAGVATFAELAKTSGRVLFI